MIGRAFNIFIPQYSTIRRKKGELRERGGEFNLSGLPFFSLFRLYYLEPVTLPNRALGGAPQGEFKRQQKKGKLIPFLIFVFSCLQVISYNILHPAKFYLQYLIKA